MTRYILGELATPTFLGLLVYLFLLLTNRFFLVAEKALAKNLGWDLTLRMFAMGIPNLLVLAIPMSVLLGCLIAVGRLSADHEWVALQGAGQGPGRLLRPMIIHGLLASLVAFLVYAEYAPRANYTLRSLRGELIFASSLASDIKPRVFYTDLDNIVLFVEEIPPASDGRLEGVLLVQNDPVKRTQELYLAAYGYLAPSGGRDGTLVLDLFDGVAHRYPWSGGEEYRYASSFGTARKVFDPAMHLRALREAPDRVVQDLPALELFEQYQVARIELEQSLAALPPNREGNPGRADRDVAFATAKKNAAEVEVASRLALPLASFFFAILALPLGVTRVRSGKGAGFALSLLVILIYWACYTFFRDQSVQQKIPGFLGPWVANLVLIVWAAWGLWKMRSRPAEGHNVVLRGLGWLFRLPGRFLSLLALKRKQRGRNGSAENAGELSELGGTTTRFVGRLDQYLLLHFLRTMSFALLSGYLIYGLVKSKSLVDGLIRTEQPLSLLLEYFTYFAPGMLALILPIASLVGAVVSMTMLSRTGELTAIKSMGISMRRASLPVLVVTLVLCGVIFLVQDRIAPAANRKAQAIEDQIMGRAPRSHGTPAGGRWAFGSEGRKLYHFQLQEPNGQTFQGLRVLTLEKDGGRPRILDHRYAETARYFKGQWRLHGGYYRTFPDDDTMSYEAMPDWKFPQNLDPPESFASQELGQIARIGDLPDESSLAELRVQIESLEGSGYDITQLRVAYHAKFAQALTPLIMVLLGLPFAFKVGRRGSLYGIGVALLLVLVYWATFAIFNALGLETILPPPVAAWAPNILYGLLGYYMMLYIKT